MKKIAAVCACPMGLAHTFMAADSLEKAAKELGIEIKIETQGADGIQNELTRKGRHYFSPCYHTSGNGTF